MIGVPVGLIEPDAVRNALDALRQALSQRSFVLAPSAAALAYDTRKIAASVSDVLGALEQIDVEARRALADFSVPFPDSEHASRLKATITELTALWQRRVREWLGADKVEALRDLLHEDSPELLDIFRKRDDENAHSDVIRWLLDPRDAPNTALPALSALASRFSEAERWREAIEEAAVSRCLAVRREFVFGTEWREEDSRDRIDVFISGPRFVLAIENKVWASEHSAQTRSYWRWLEKLECLKAGVFLSPTGMPAACAEFVPLAYLDLVACLLEGPTRGPISSTERAVLAGYLKTLARGVLRAELNAVLEEEPWEP